MLYIYPLLVAVFLQSSLGVPVARTLCGGRNYTYEYLAGYGLIASNARDKYGDTIGGIGSAIAIDRQSWTKTGDGQYSGVLWALPDRGWYGRSQ